MKKRIRRLTYEDLGQHAIFYDDDGDKYTGVFNSLTVQTSSGLIGIGRASIHLGRKDFDREIELTAPQPRPL